jgi:predicted TIM-barrel fold metal-dependent hydrolase
MDGDGLPILDCHQHFFDARRLHYPVFTRRSAAFEALLGDYSALPRVYLPEDYARDTSGLNVVKTVWAEFVSDDPVGEVRWAEEVARATGRPDGMIALVDFLGSGLDRTLDAYAAMKHVRCVRQHLGWHPTNPLLRYALRPDLLADPAWRRGLAALRGRDLCCEIEIFAPQLPELASTAAAHPDLRFILPVMGWPVDLTSGGHAAWKRGLAAVAACDNVAVKIFGMECLFGLHWTVAQVRPWILETIELFGPDRCMFASHLPICQLACSVQRLYGAYLEVIADFSVSEKRQLLHDTAAAVYGV